MAAIISFAETTTTASANAFGHRSQLCSWFSLTTMKNYSIPIMENNLPGDCNLIIINDSSIQSLSFVSQTSRWCSNYLIFVSKYSFPDPRSPPILLRERLRCTSQRMDFFYWDIGRSRAASFVCFSSFVSISFLYRIKESLVSDTN